MSEVLNNLIKGLAWALGIVSVIGGLYIGIASLGDDAATAYAAETATRWQAVHNEPETRRWEAGVADFYDHHWAWTFHMIAHPHFLQYAWGKVVPPVDDIGQFYKGNWWNGRLARMTFTQKNLIHHFAIPTVGGMGVAVILELILLPLVRARVAKSLASTNRKIFGRTRDLPRGDGFVLARDVRLDRKGGGNPHVLTIGPSGGSKTASQVIPSVLQLPKDCGAVITDPKGEILARCGDRLRRQGHEVIVLGPLAGFGHGLDPLKLCKSADNCRDMAQQILQAGSKLKGGGGEDEKWNNMTRACLAAYLIQAWSEGLGLADALQTMYADDFSGEAITHSAALLNYRMYESLTKSGSTDGSVLGTLQSVIQEWTQAKVVGWMNCERQFKFESLRNGAVVFLVSSASDARKSKPIQRFLFSRLFDFLAASHGANVRIWIDEFANLGQLEGIDEALTLLRSAGVGIHAFVQNLSQVFYVNGRDGGAVIAESFGTVCVFAGLRNDAADLAKLLGEDSDVRPSYSTQDEKMRAQFSEQRRQAVDGATLRQIGSKQVLIINGNRKPVLAKLKPWYSRLGRLRRLVLPKIFRKDWDKIPPEARDAFFNGLPKIEPIEIVLPPKPKKKGGDNEKPKRKTVRIDMDDLAGALAPHIKPQMPAPEDDGYADTLASSADPFAGLDLGSGEKDPNA